MKKKLIGIIAVMTLLFAVMTGCTTSDGMRLSKAMLQSADLISVESSSNLSINVKTEGLDLTEKEHEIIEKLNNAEITFNSASDVQNTKASIRGNVKIDDVKYTGRLYVHGNKMLLKIPQELKYIEINPEAMLPTQSDKLQYQKSLELQKETRQLALNFVKQYVKEYKFTFDNLENLGTSEIETPDGVKEITTYKITFDEDNFKEFLKYTVNDVINSDSLKLYYLSVTRLMAENQGMSAEEIEGFVQLVEQQFDQLKQIYAGSPEQVDMYINLAMNYFRFGEEGISYTVGIDKDDNIVKSEVIYDLSFKYLDKNVNILLKSDSINYGFNSTKVNIPTFLSSRVMSLKDYAKSNEAIKNSTIGDLLGVKKKSIKLKIGDSVAYTNDEVNFLDAEPIIQNNTTLVPVRFVGESLGAVLEWRDEDRSVIYKDGDVYIIMQIDNKVAHVNERTVELPTTPIIKNGRALVPLRFISEELGATVIWNDDFNTITIEK